MQANSGPMDTKTGLLNHEQPGSYILVIDLLQPIINNYTPADEENTKGVIWG
jgi:hypothetical protein